MAFFQHILLCASTGEFLDRTNAVLELLQSRLHQAPSGRNIVIIHGHGGAGKSKQAQAVYNRIRELRSATGRSAFKECHVTLDTQPDIFSLQQQLYRQIKMAEPQITREQAGEQLAAAAAASKSPLLMLLDNVRCWQQLSELLTDTFSMPDGSRVIVTTQSHIELAGCLEDWGRVQLYSQPLLDRDENRSLFRQTLQGSGHGSISTAHFNETEQNRVADACGGLPLLTVQIATALRKRRERWQQAFDDLKGICTLSGQERTAKDWLKLLQVSVDMLELPVKRVFLHLALSRYAWSWLEATCFCGHHLPQLEDLSLVQQGDVDDRPFAPGELLSDFLILSDTRKGLLQSKGTHCGWAKGCIRAE